MFHIAHEFVFLLLFHERSSTWLDKKHPTSVPCGKRGGTEIHSLCQPGLHRYYDKLIRSFIEYTLLSRPKVKYWSSNIIHSSRSFKERCLMSGNIDSGTMSSRPSVKNTAILPRCPVKSSLLIPTFTYLSSYT